MLANLGPNFKEVVATIRVRDSPISFDELHGKLSDFELQLKKQSTPETPNSLIVPTANYTQRSNNFPSRNQYNHGNSSFFRPQFINNAPANRSQWQTKSSTSTSSPCSTTYCHFCNRPRHSTKDYRQLARFLRENDITPTANLTSLQPPNPASQLWLFDTGASHHVTSHFNNLQQPSACGGPDDIHLGDGSGLQITHTGTTSLTSASQKFHLDNIMCSISSS